MRHTFCPALLLTLKSGRPRRCVPLAPTNFFKPFVLVRLLVIWFDLVGCSSIAQPSLTLRPSLHVEFRLPIGLKS
jgi:hypothetical protein